MEELIPILFLIGVSVFFNVILKIFGRGALNTKNDRTWGGSRMQTPPQSLPTDPNAIRIPDEFLTPSAQAATTPESPPKDDGFGSDNFSDPFASDRGTAEATLAGGLPSDSAMREKRLAEIESYYKQGIISKKEYQQQRKAILRQYKSK